METIKVKLKELKTNKENPRTITKYKMDKLVNSILVFPKMLDIRPIVVDGNMTALGGNQRTEALKRISKMTADKIHEKLSGITDYQRMAKEEHDNLILFWKEWMKSKEVPVINADNLTDDEKKQFIIKDNNSFGEWDFAELSEKWDASKLEDWGVDLPDDWSVNDEEEGNNEAKEDDFTDEDADNVETRVKYGDIWQLGEHRLMCGDSTKKEDVERLMDGEKADMVLSDPPYGMKLDTDYSSCVGSMKSIGGKNKTRGNKYEKVIGDNEDFTPELITTFFENFGYCKEIFLFGADYFAEILPNKNDGSWLVWDKRKESQANAIGSEFELIWSRNRHKRRMLRFDWFGFLSSVNPKEARNRVHPTQKPTSLLESIINQWGEKAQIVVDLYGGSGSTLIACEQLNRKCRMMELSEHYASVIIERYIKIKGSAEDVFRLNLDGTKTYYNELYHGM